jgi:glutathione S-transferase
MKLYFNPLACSLASRIAVYESGLPIELVFVNTVTKRTSDDSDYRTIHSLGQVPALVRDDGSLLTENAAVLQYIAELAGQLPGVDRPQLHKWLGFIGTELHKGFTPLLDKKAPPEAKAYARTKLLPKLAYVEEHLARQPTLLGAYTIADGYLFAILNWTTVTDVKLADYPALAAFHARMLARPAIARAFQEEYQLYLDEQNRAH